MLMIPSFEGPKERRSGMGSEASGKTPPKKRRRPRRPQKE
jgi:hypothetical protein